MTKTTKITLGAVALFILFLIFSNAKPIYKVAYACAGIFACYMFYRVKGEYLLEQNARSSLDDLIKQKNFIPDYKHFFSEEGLVSGVAISKSDPRILLQSGELPAVLFPRDGVLSIKRLKGVDKYDETWESDNSFKAHAALSRVEVLVKDLNNPCYKLYFENDDLTRQWEGRLTAWLDTHATK